MKTDHYGQLIFNESDIVDLVLQGYDILKIKNMYVDESVDLESAAGIIECMPEFLRYEKLNIGSVHFDHLQQANWYMPAEYKELDIAVHILDLCKTQEELQRVGEELLLYQERDLFNLLKYLKYLVDTMKDNNVIWGVGRGSSVSSYVLYLLGVHRINSMFYDLDIREFLR